MFWFSRGLGEQLQTPPTHTQPSHVEQQETLKVLSYHRGKCVLRLLKPPTCQAKIGVDAALAGTWQT